MYTDSHESIALVRAAFPHYQHARGRLSVRPFKGPVSPTSYWSGGQRDYWAIVDMTTHVAAVAATNGSGFGLNPHAAPAITELPEGKALVRYTHGPRDYATIYVNPENLSPMLPESVELHGDEAAVLHCTKRYTSRARRQEFARALGDYTVRQQHLDRWDAAVESLVKKGLLLKSGAITTTGRNVAESLP